MSKTQRKSSAKVPSEDKKETGPHSAWSGSISFGLINIPVKLQTAIREKSVHFSLYREKDHCKIRRKYICETDQKEVLPSEMVKGYPVEEGQHVMIHQEEIEKLAPEATHEISLLQFSDLSAIDPIYFGQHYYVVPQKNGKKAYSLLTEALKKSKRIGIAQMVMRNKQYLAVLRVYQDILCLETLHYADEIASAKVFEPTAGKVSAKEIETAEKLIDSLTEPLHLEKFNDTYRETLLNVLNRKKRVTTTEIPKEKHGEIVDLMAALEASLKANKKKAA